MVRGVDEVEVPCSVLKLTAEATATAFEVFIVDIHKLFQINSPAASK